MEQLLKFVILLLVIIVIILLHISIILKKKFEQKDKKPGSLEYSKVLPQYRNRKCEITVKEPMPVTNVMFSEKVLYWKLMITGSCWKWRRKREVQ